MNTQRLEELLIAWEDEQLASDELAELKRHLAADPAARQRLVESGVMRRIVADRASAIVENDKSEHVAFYSAEAKLSHSHWLQWRPLWAAAAGIVFGMLCTSVVFAYVAPSLEKAITLLQESFESGPAPLVTGVPREAGRWSGDYSEIVGEQQGIKPQHGKKMLRLLRTDYEGKPGTEQSRIGDVYRLIDVRAYRADIADGGAVVQFSAGFNAFEFSGDEDDEAKMSIQAYDTETATNGSLRVGNTRTAGDLAGAGSGRILLDRNPATWQRMTGDLRLPPDTEFLLIRIALGPRGPSPARPRFDGHYIDDVRVTMMRRNPLP